jgi:hypothetical protein
VIKDVRHGAGVSQDGGEDGPAVAPTAVLGSFMLAPQSEPIVGGPPPPLAADMPRTSSARLLSPVQVDVAEFRRWALGPDDTRARRPGACRRPQPRAKASTTGRPRSNLS